MMLQWCKPDGDRGGIIIGTWSHNSKLSVIVWTWRAELDCGSMRLISVIILSHCFCRPCALNIVFYSSIQKLNYFGIQWMFVKKKNTNLYKLYRSTEKFCSAMILNLGAKYKGLSWNVSRFRNPNVGCYRSRLTTPAAQRFALLVLGRNLSASSKWGKKERGLYQ